MKTSQIRNFAIQLSKSKSTKFKLNHAGKDDQDNKFTTNDLRNVQLVQQFLKKAKEAQVIISSTIIDINSQLLQKIKRCIPGAYKNQINKSRFRIVKSAKKLGKLEAKNDDEGFQLMVKPKKMNLFSEIIQNKSQVISSKLANKDLYLPDHALKSPQCTSRLPLADVINNKQNNVKQRVIIPGVLDLNEKPKSTKQKVLMVGSKQDDPKLRNYKENIQALKEQNKKLRQMLQQISGPQNPKIELHISLKCIQVEQIKQEQKNEVKDIQSEQIQINKNLKQRQNYLQETISHLQLIIVSQNKEIESLMTKLLENKIKNKISSRWNQI